MTASTPPLPLVVFVSEILPIETAASSVVLYRHLRSLEGEGFDICVIVPGANVKSTDFPTTWQQILLPSRRFYYPPYRPYGPLKLARWVLLDRIVRPALSGRKVHCIIGLLMAEYLVGYAAWLSQHLQRPLFYFYHDRGESLHHAKTPAGATRLKRQNLALLSTATLKRVWTVTPELTYDEPSLSGKFKVVYPLAEPLIRCPIPKWRPEWSSAPVLAYAGTIYKEVVESIRTIVKELAKVNGRLLVYSHFAETADALRQEFPNVVSYAGYIPGTVEMCRRILDDASAFLVVYPADIKTMPWSLDCFPSKFTQLAQTNLPGLILAPPETAVGRWCINNKWSLYRPTVDADSARSIISELCKESSWSQAAGQTLTAAKNTFSPQAAERLVNEDVREANLN